MYRRAYTQLLAAIALTAISLGTVRSLSAHTGQQVFDTFESITGEQLELSSPASLNVSTSTKSLTGKELIYAVFPKETPAN